MKYLDDIVKMNGDWAQILDSVMPGGENWKKFQEVKDCLPICPGRKECHESGPEGLVCSEDWRKAEANSKSLDVVRHVLENFEYYDRNDSPFKEKEEKIKQLLAEIKRHLTCNPSPDRPAPAKRRKRISHLGFPG
jgi:hypothetical protein